MEKPFEVDVSCRNGAPMGRYSDAPEEFAGRRTHLQRVPFVDGDYDPGGAYWGGGRNVLPLYCAWTAPDDGEPAVMYFRAGNRSEAKAEIPGARFFR